MKKVFLLLFLWSGVASAASTSNVSNSKDLLVKLNNSAAVTRFSLTAQNRGAEVTALGNNWVRVQTASKGARLLREQIEANPEVAFVQPNYKIKLMEDYKLADPSQHAALLKKVARANVKAPADNPAIPVHGSGGSGMDPLFTSQWGMIDNNVKDAWKYANGKGMVVAVIDTGVDYTHEDLVDNLWHNAGEMGKDAQGKDKATNNADDDGNGYIDDVIGWDFVTNDNKPYDLSVDPMQLLMGGGNPGHGTHCAGNVAARTQNGKGVAGVAPETKIMSLRFLSEKGQGTTAEAIRAINYAVANGAQVLSNSWGSEGEDSAEQTENQALRDAITNAMNHNVLFIGAAGNGHNGVGYNNDSDAKPAYPASYDMENIISVAALDSANALGSFSNWGARTVDIGAPGVKVFSTTVGSKYADTVFDMFGMKITWDGTSMATPHVAGAAALYWSKHPEMGWRDVKEAILQSAAPVSSLNGKCTSNGKLNVSELMKR